LFGPAIEPVNRRALYLFLSILFGYDAITKISNY